VNGQSINSTYSNGVLTAQMSLQEGANSVEITANGCETISVTYTITYEVPCSPPVVSINAGTTTVEAPAYSLSATVTNITNASDISVTLNGQAVPSSLSGNQITASLTLTEGVNTIVVTANGCQVDSKTLVVTYNLPCNGPVITLGNNATAVNSTAYNLSASVTNITNSNDITVKLNGQTVPHNFSVNQITASLTLIEGVNSIVITANGCQADSKSLSVTYTPPCDAPVITINGGGATVEAAVYTLSATVTNITDPAAISVKLNGAVVPSSLNGNQITASMTLNEGANTIIITATGCAVDTKSAVVTYNVPCDAPVVTINGGGATVEAAAYNLSATVTNITDPAAISVKLNGQVVPSTLNGNQITASLTLIAGANSIQVIANGCQVDTKTTTITYTAGPCGPRFNPGNSAWQFCLVTSQGTYTRDDLQNSGFTYAGTATSVYFKPIAGGGDVTVAGQPYSVQNGQYYLFEGNLTVDVSSSHPGSMGHWEICLTADNEPQFGNGNNRPTSPCETTNGGGNNGGGNNGGGNNGGGNNDDINVEGDGTVHVDENFCANIKCLGESVIYNNSQEAYVTVEYSIDGGSSWYEFNGDNYVNGGEQLTVQAPTGSDIVLRSICVNEQGNWANTEVSNSGSQYVYVLQNGDVAPNFAPTQGQASVETFLAGLVDQDGNVTIGPNDVIYLFELRFVGNYGIDYQDCVMLITLDEGSSCPPPTNPVSTNKGTGNNSGNNSGGGNTTEGVNTDKNTGGGSITTNGGVGTLPTPAFTLVKPAGLSETVSSSSYMLKTKVSTIKDKSGISMSLNGKSFTGFSFAGSTGAITAVLKLRSGANTVKITANNGSKSASKTFTINYKAQQNETAGGTVTTTGGVGSLPAPAFTNIKPAGTSETVSSGTYMLKAKVSTIKTKSGISVYLNGKPFTGFSFSSGTGMITAVLKLKAGANTVKITANNGTKKASKTYTINYKSQGNETAGGNVTTTGGVGNLGAPVFKNVNPAENSASVTTSTFMLKTKVSNVKSKSSIKVTINGANFAGFSFSSSTGQVTAVLRLRQGSNAVKVTATNAGKTVSKSYTITYKPKQVINNNGGGTIKNTGGGSIKTGGGKTETGGGTTKTGGGTVKTGGGTTKTGGGTIKTGGGTTKTGGGTIKTGGGTTKTGGGTIKTGGGTTKTGGGTIKTGGGTTKTGGGTIKTGGGTTKTGGGTVKTGGGTTETGGGRRGG